jgi:predicted nuclease of predicted toxin-antitoxin system
VKFLVDMPLSPEMAAWLRAEGHEALHASGVGMSQSPDAEILRAALGEDRVVITADLDFPRLLAALGTDGPGLILLRGGNYSEAESFECVRRVLAAIPAEELTRSIVVVDSVRIRRRWLPI